MNLRSTHYSLEMKLPDSSEQIQPAWHRNGECCVIQEARPVWHMRSLTSKEDAVATSNQLQSYQIFLLFIWCLVMGFRSRNTENKGWWKDNDQGLHWKSFRGKFTTGREGGELTWLGDRGCHRGISSYAARSRRGPSPPFPWGSIRTTCMWCDSRIRRGGNLSNKPIVWRSFGTSDHDTKSLVSKSPRWRSVCPSSRCWSCSCASSSCPRAWFSSPSLPCITT